MKRILWWGLIALAFGIFTLPASLSYAQSTEKKKVLILNSYHIGYKWTDDIVKAIQHVLSDKSISLYIEYMDTKRISDERYFQQLHEIYKLKYDKVKFDVIISSDDDAFNFLGKYRDDIFPNTPVVFYTLFLRDKSGKWFEYDESISLISSKSKVPIYCTWDFSLGYGTMGGMLASGFYQVEKIKP